MSQKYLIRIAELESQLRQKDQQLSLVEETEAFLRSALARAEEKIEEDEREIEHLRAQIQQQMKTLSRHSDTAKAFAYLLKQWDALNVYCSNGWVEIDNN
ncbi:IS66 family transposase, partial [Escherichia coli]